MDTTNPYQAPDTPGGPVPDERGPSLWPLRLILLGQLLLLSVGAAFTSEAVPETVVYAVESVVFLALAVTLWLGPLLVVALAWSARLRGFSLAVVLMMQAFITLAMFLAVLPGVQ